jgi:hypothetical protein
MANRAPAPSLSEQVQVLRVLEAVYRSDAEGRDIAL